jgi:hypothetical protein
MAGMKVNINADGRQVEIECSDANVSPRDIAAEALAVWKATDGSKGSDGPAYGFTPQIQLDNNRSTYGPASFRHGDRPVVE